MSAERCICMPGLLRSSGQRCPDAATLEVKQAAILAINRRPLHWDDVDPEASPGAAPEAQSCAVDPQQCEATATTASPKTASSSDNEAQSVAATPTSIFKAVAEFEAVTSKPQQVVLKGRMHNFWSEHWGMTVTQVRALIETCRADAGWRRSNTMRDLVNGWVKPETEGTGLGYALLVNQKKPLQVNVMVSHSWNENAEEFVESLERTVWKDDVLFICAFSIFQNGDGSGPSIAEQLGSTAEDSPFYRVLRHIRMRNRSFDCRLSWLPWLKALPTLLLTVALFLFAVPILFQNCIPSYDYCYCPNAPKEAADVGRRAMRVYSTMPLHLSRAYRPIVMAASIVLAIMPLAWLFMRSKHSRQGHLVAVPNRQDDLYMRLWCVYEIFVATMLGVPVTLANTFAFAGTCTCQKATCSSATDIAHIRTEIEEWGVKNFGDGPRAFDVVDRKIRQVTRAGHYTTFFVMLRAMMPLAILCMIATQLEMKATDTVSGAMVAANVLGTKLGWVFLVMVVFFAVQRAQGEPSSMRLASSVIVLLSVSAMYALCSKAASIDPHHSPGVMFLKKFGYAPYIGSQYMCAYILCHLLLKWTQCNRRAKTCLKWCVMLFITTFHVAMELRGAGIPVSFYDDGYPWIMFMLSRLGYYLGILIFGFWAFTRWGVHISMEAQGPICRCASLEHTLRRLRTGSGIMGERVDQAPSARFDARARRADDDLFTI